MSDIAIFIAGLFGMGIVGIATAIFMLRLNPANIQYFEKIARLRHVGAILAFIGLLWCVPNAKPIVWDWMLPALYPLVLAFTIIAWLFLDYLFARAVGGLCILTAYWFLHDAFTFHSLWSPLFAIFCWTIGIAGLFFSAKPHLFRDMLRKIADRQIWKVSITTYLILFALFSITSAIMLLAK
ncbi:MAG: hypothetical protein L3J71_12280 [Victivallaceae bacterium]|nr:hypothetical protein [Victivallaceae bacterium]